MNKKDLTDLGIAEDVAEKIIVLHGKDIEGHKTSLSTEKQRADTLATQLSEANKQIETFKGLKVEDIQKAADDYKAKFEQAQKDAVTQVEKVKFDSKLEAALTAAKVKDSLSVMPHLKLDALKLNEDGSILGLKEQLDAIKSTKDFLFESDVQTPVITTGGNNQPLNLDTVSEAARKGAGLSVTGEK